MCSGRSLKAASMWLKSMVQRQWTGSIHEGPSNWLFGGSRGLNRRLTMCGSTSSCSRRILSVNKFLNLIHLKYSGMKGSNGEQDGEEQTILLEQGTVDWLMQHLSEVVVNKSHSLGCKAGFHTFLRRLLNTRFRYANSCHNMQMSNLIEQVDEPGQTELVDVIDVCMPSISRAVFWMSGCQNLLRMKLF